MDALLLFNGCFVVAVDALVLGADLTAIYNLLVKY